jgi:hypothetical protein
MPINKNHEFEELEGIKCGIVEKNVTPERVSFLKKILEYNHYKVVVVPSPPPKAALAAKLAEGETAPVIAAPPATFTIGVSDYTFNPTNAIFGRQLKTPEGGLVTQAYWLQKEISGKDEVPYYERK